MARVPSFQRKGPPAGHPALMIAIGKPKGDDGQADGGDAQDGPEESGMDEAHDENEIATCPNCGCTFNDQTGKIIPDGHPQHPASGGGMDGTGAPAGGSGGDESGASGAGGY